MRLSLNTSPDLHTHQPMMQLEGYDVTLAPNSYETVDVLENFSTDIGVTDDSRGVAYQGPVGPLMYTLVVIIFYISSIVILMVKSAHKEKQETDQTLHYEKFLKKNDFVSNVKRDDRTPTDTQYLTVDSCRSPADGKDINFKSNTFTSRNLGTLHEV